MANDIGLGWDFLLKKIFHVILVVTRLPSILGGMGVVLCKKMTEKAVDERDPDTGGVAGLVMIP